MDFFGAATLTRPGGRVGADRLVKGTNLNAAVVDWIVKTFESDLSREQIGNDPNQASQRATQAIQLSNDENFAWPKSVEQSVQNGQFALRSSDDLCVSFHAAGILLHIDLHRIDRLVLGANASVIEFHDAK